MSARDVVVGERLIVSYQKKESSCVEWSGRVTMYISKQKSSMDRRTFNGGSDARIIMEGDEAALIRLWREKRGEIEPEDLSGNLVV
jgi:hypothetical protein